MTNDSDHEIAMRSCPICDGTISAAFARQIVNAASTTSQAMTADQFAMWLSENHDAPQALNPPRSV